jgi:hypothetical protein
MQTVNAFFTALQKHFGSSIDVNFKVTAETPTPTGWTSTSSVVAKMQHELAPIYWRQNSLVGWTSNTKEPTRTWESGMAIPTNTLTKQNMDEEEIMLGQIFLRCYFDATLAGRHIFKSDQMADVRTRLMKRHEMVQRCWPRVAPQGQT